MGRSCYDGGLQENNPIHIAVSESKRVWGSSAPFEVAAKAAAKVVVEVV